MPPRRSALKIFTIDRDNVVSALVATGRTDYRYALKHLYPLIDQLEIQRRIQNPRFYDRLKRDIPRECLMPPITLAFIRKNQRGLNTVSNFEKFVNANIADGFILDGIQRLSTLKRAYDESSGSGFPNQQSLFVNVIVCNSMDNLLYRMITLNNGQRPMTTRHQIEILTGNLFAFDSDGVMLATEKERLRRRSGVFAQGDFVLGYMAFLSSSTNVDSQKLIQEKLDELLANKILEHDPTQDTMQFSDVIDLVSTYIKNPYLERWFRTGNNLIGFCSAARSGFKVLKRMSPLEFEQFIKNVEEAFRSFDVSKIKLGRARRNAVSYAVKNVGKLSGSSVSDITDKLVDVLE